MINTGTVAESSSYSDSIISTYCEMGAAALQRGEYKIAEKMYQAALNEPAVKREKTRFIFPLLMNLGRTREGQRRYYKAKLVYIRALAHYKRHHRKAGIQVALVLVILARVNAKQGLFKQVCEFLQEARVSLTAEDFATTASEFDELQTLLDDLSALLQLRGRTDEYLMVEQLISITPKSRTIDFSPGT